MRLLFWSSVRTPAVQLLSLGVVALLAGCAARADALPFVDLADRQPLPAVGEADVTPLRVAFAAVISPRGTVEGYQPLVDYLAERLDRPVELVQRRTYAEVNDLVRRGEVDLAFVCTSAYVIGHREFGMQLLAAPRVNGETVYHSYLIVPSIQLGPLHGRPRGQDIRLHRSLVHQWTDGAHCPSSWP